MSVWIFFIWVFAVALAFVAWLYYLKKKGEKMGLSQKRKSGRQGRKTTLKKWRRRKHRYRKS